jgi:hypothetical protein
MDALLHGARSFFGFAAATHCAGGMNSAVREDFASTRAFSIHQAGFASLCDLCGFAVNLFPEGVVEMNE